MANDSRERDISRDSIKFENDNYDNITRYNKIFTLVKIWRDGEIVGMD